MTRRMDSYALRCVGSLDGQGRRQQAGKLKLSDLGGTRCEYHNTTPVLPTDAQDDTSPQLSKKDNLSCERRIALA